MGPAAQYDIEADWMIMRTCNFRCDYCFLSPEKLGEKIEVQASPLKWRDAFDRSGMIWLLHMTGGEPTHYPDFVALSEAVTARHYMSLNSNLTGVSALRFAERIDPKRVSFINAGLHPAERNRRSAHEVFLRHAGALLERGFPLMASVVATPEVLRGFEAIVDSLKPIGLVPFPKLMQGARSQDPGRTYPESYTEEERALFRRHSEWAERANPKLFGKGISRPSIDPTLGRKHLAKDPNYIGQLCTAGKEFVRIGVTGDVRRCGGGSTMGNLFEGNVQYARKAKPCDRGHCFYFCEKFTARAAEQQRAKRTPMAIFKKKIKRAVAAVAGR